MQDDVPYSGKLSREKTFAFFSAKFCGRRYSLGVWPYCAHAQLSISYRYSVRIDVTSFALAGKNLSSSSIPYIFVHVVTQHDGLYCVAAAHIRCFFWRCMRAVQSACRRDPQCARCVYAGALRMRKGHTYIIIGPEQSAKVFSAKFSFCTGFSIESFPLYGI